MSRIVRALRVTFAAAALAWAGAASAQFPITESFTGATAPGWTLLGNAELTAAAATNPDPVGSGWLRLTSATGNQAGSAIYNTAFASTSGIAITFDYADYGGTGADGFTFYLINGTTAVPTVGAYGGPLGYAGRYGNISTTRCANGTMSVTTPGVTNGYVGIGFDEFGNFSNCESGWNALSTTTQQPQSVVIRGSGSLSTAKAFKYLTSQQVNVAPFNSTIDGAPRTAPRRARVSIVSRKITVAIDFGAGFQTVIDAFDLAKDADQAALPATFKMGISGSTGGSTNVHEIRNVRVELPANLALAQAVTPTTVSVGGTITFTITVTNDATNAANGTLLADAFPAGLTNVSWTAATTGGAVLSRTSGTGNLAETITTFPKSATVTYTVTATVGAAAAGQVLSNTVTLTPPAGVANLLSNTSAAVITVNKMGSATALASAPTPSRSGQPVTLTATVTAVAPGSGTPGGTVTFLDGATTLGTGTLDASGKATFTTSALAVGSHALTASYGGSPSFLASGPAAATQVVNQALTTTTLGAAPAGPVAGQAVTLTATVAAQAPGAGTPGGTVTFLDGAAPLGTGTLDAAGVATFTTSSLAVGAHALSASYGGAAAFAASASGATPLTVARVTPVVGLAAAPAPSVFGQPVTFTATLVATPPGTGIPGGLVTFLDGAAVLGTGALDASGKATFTTASLAPGARTITAAYAGDARFLPAGSSALVHQVDPAATATSVAAAPSPAVFGQAVTFTATVTTQAPGAGTPVGTVTFLEGGTPLGTGALDAAGQATFTTAALAAGAHAVTASYGGAVSHQASASASTFLSVAPAATQLTLVGQGGAAVHGQPRTFTATVATLAPGAGTPAGTVTFSEGASVLGSAALDAAGAAALAISLPAGPHTVTATFAATPSFLGSGGTADAAVLRAASATALVAGPSPALPGEPLLLEATVVAVAPGAGTPGGTVTFLDGAAVVGTATLDAAGTARLTLPAPAVGPHAFTADFGGDAAFTASASPAAAVEVVPAATTVALDSALLTATFGDAVPLTAQVLPVAPATGLPAGLVRFLADGLPLGEAALDATGHATFLVPGGALTAGAHLLTAEYLGDGQFLAATSAEVVESVSRAATSVAVTAGAATVTGQAASFTATVTVPASLRAATGTVSFYDGATFLGSAPLDAAGQATFTTAALAAGPHAITARYAGDGDYAGADSAASPHQVDPAATGTALSAGAAASTFGQAVVLTAQVTAAAPGAGTPTGTVTFLDGAAVLGTATLDAAGQATLSAAALPGGARSLTARYEGSPAFTGSTSSPLGHQVDPAAAALALAAAPSPARRGEPVVLTATVTSAAGIPAGTVTFKDGATVLGTASLDAAGVAHLAAGPLSVGDHALAADYAGSEDFAPATGAASLQVVQGGADVALSAAPSPAVTGQPVLLSVQVSARAPAAGVPTGTVRILDGGVVIATLPLAGGVASVLADALTPGVHALTAEYDGDAAFLADATAAPTLLAIDPAATATTLAAPAAARLTEPVTLTATVAVLAPGAGLPSGTVTFSEGAATLGTAELQPDGTAALTLPALPVGAHDLVATYGGDPAFALSVSDPAHLDVSTAEATLLVSVSPSPAVVGQPVTITVIATPVAPALGPVAGTVTIRDGATVLATLPLDAAGQATFTTPALAVGPHLLAADLAGTGFTAAASPEAALQVEPAASATTLAAAPTPSISGQPVHLAATVTAVAPGAGTPSGTVTFLDGAAVLGTAALDATGVAVLDAPLAAGAHQLTASFGGEPRFLPSAAALDQPVEPGATSTAVVAAPSPATYGEAVTLTAMVLVLDPAAAPAEGPVTFFVDGLLAGSAPAAAGVATLALPAGALHGGAHLVSAAFQGSTELAGSAAPEQALLVVPAPVTLDLAALPAAPVIGEPVVLRATAASAAGVPGGLVTFTDGGALLGTAALDAAGTATLAVGPLAPGGHALAADLPASADFAAAGAATSATVALGGSATTLVADRASAVTGQPVTFTATVAPLAPSTSQPAGLVTFLDGAAVLGTAALDGAGQATFSTAALTPGAHAVTAAFPGDAALAPSTSAPAPVAVDAAATALTLAAAPSPARFGQAVTLTARMAVQAPGAGVPAGTVTFLDGAAVLGTAALDATGTATLATSALAAGDHALSATWPGDAALLGASGEAALAVSRAATATALAAAPASSVIGETVVLTATVTSAAGTPAGTVTFRDGAAVLGTASLSGGTASLGVSTLTIGAHALAADYEGTPDFAPSSGDAAVAVSQAIADVALAAAPSPAVTGQPVLLSILVSARAPGVGVPTGTVRILDGGVVIATLPLAGGVASVLADTLTPGVHALTAEYDGDPSFPSAATPLPVVLAIDPAATATTLAAPAAARFTEPVTLTATVAVLAPGAGLPSGTVTFSEGATTLGTAEVQPDGAASLTLPALPVGPHDLVATYGGDPAFALSVSDPAHLDVSTAEATLLVTASPSPAVVGQPVTITVIATPVAPALGPVAGTVTIRDGATVLATLPLDAAGQATFTTPALAVGPHALTADLAGAGFTAAASPEAALQVGPAASATSLVAAPSPALFGQPVVLTATVAVQAPGAAALTGAVTFTLDGAPAGSALLAGGQATLGLGAGLAPGTHLVTAAWAGTAEVTGSASPAAELVVSAAPATLTLAALPAAPVSGQPVQLRVAATSPAGTPAGDVTVTVNGAALAPVALDAAGVATVALGAFPAGDVAVAALLPAGPAFGEASAAAVIPVARAATALALQASPGAAVAGQPVTLTATVGVLAPGAGLPAGLVTFSDGTTILGTAALDGAGAAALTTTLPVGTHLLTAAWAGDAALLGSEGSAPLTVDPAASQVALAALPAAAVTGQPVVLTAVVTPVAPGAAPVAGEVTFLEGADVLGTVALDAGGTAALALANLSTGAHQVTAAYAGAGDLLGSASAPAAVAVSAATTTLALTASPSPAAFGQAVTLTARVAVVAPGAGAPAGTVTFLDGGAVLGTGTLDASGTATLTTSALAAGGHALSADWPGDAALAGSQGTAALTVGAAATATAVAAAPATAHPGEAVTLTATVTSPAGVPTGTVAFTDGADPLGTAPVDAGGQATLVVTTLAVGQHAIGAAYGGAPAFAPSAAATAAGVTISPADASVAVASTRNPSRRNRPVTFVATVTAPPGAGGTVRFWDDSGAAPELLGSVPLTGSTASWSTRDLLKGTHAIRAEYLGDAVTAAASGTLAGGQVVENTPPVAGAGAALSLGGAAAPASATLAASATAAAVLDAAQGTVELWARATWTDAAQAAEAPTLARLSGPGGVRWSLGVAPDRRGAVVTVGAATATIPAALDDGAWHHLALVGEAAGTTLLVDGVEAGALAEPFGPAGATTLVVGDGFTGELDELRTWSVARTAADLAGDARTPLTGREPGLTGLWRFDEGAGLEAFDAGPAGLDLAIAAAAAPAEAVAFAPSAAWRDRQVAAGQAMTPAAAGYDADEEDALTLTITAPPAQGTAQADQAARLVRYTASLAGGDVSLGFGLSDGAAASEYTLAITVTAPAVCTASSQCGAGQVCAGGTCVAAHDLDVRSGGCGCGNAGGGALALWSVVSLALLRRRRPVAGGRQP